MTLRRPKMRSKTAVAMALLLIAVAAASTSVAPSSTVLAQSSGICDRTQEVQDAILAKLSDVSDCANVTDSHLAGITGDLTLSNESIAALKAGDFHGLSGLEQLYLNDNNLSDLPDGIFDGLESLDTLWLNFNTGSPFSLAMTLEQEGSNSVVVKVAEGAPFDMQITLAAEGGILSSTTVTVEGGSIKSEAVSVSPSDQSRVQTADVQVTVSVESSDFSATDYSKLLWPHVGRGRPAFPHTGAAARDLRPHPGGAGRHSGPGVQRQRMRRCNGHPPRLNHLSRCRQ